MIKAKEEKVRQRLKKLRKLEITYFSILVIESICSFVMLNIANALDMGINLSNIARIGCCILQFLGIIELVVAIASGIIGVILLILEKNGKICPYCGTINFQSALQCGKCKQDTRNAKSVAYFSPKMKK